MMHVFNIRTAELEIISKLGEGSFGSVFLGKWNKRHVAIKKLAASMMAAHVSDFFREASLMLSIPPHKNIVRVYGMCQEMNNFSLVMEFLPNGSLDAYLANAKADGEKLSPTVIYRIVRGITRGMAHLATQNIIHRDLAASTSSQFLLLIFIIEDANEFRLVAFSQETFFWTRILSPR
jgi:serine/threonine protein kinase